MKPITLRMDEEQARLLELIARADGSSMTAFVRDAIDAHIQARRSDSEFMERLRTNHEKERELYERLAKGPEDEDQ